MARLEASSNDGTFQTHLSDCIELQQHGRNTHELGHEKIPSCASNKG